MKKQVSIFLVSSLIILNLISCSLNKPVQQGISNQENTKIQIVATVFPPYDFAKAITGNRAICTLLINPGSDVHSFSPTPEDIIKIQNADVFIYIGNKDDEWVYSTLGSMDPHKQKIIKLTDYVIPIKKESVENKAKETEPDEHIISFPTNAILLVDVITKNLCEIDPNNTKLYMKNANSYKSKIQKTDDEIKEMVSKSSDQILVLGDYFPLRYFVDKFNLIYRAADCEKKSTEKGTGTGTLVGLINAVKENNIRFVFYVTLNNPKITEEISEKTEAEMVQLQSCHNLTREDFKNGATYLSIMTQNAAILKKVLK